MNLITKITNFYLFLSNEKKKIVVQIPCLNEEKGIANVIKQIKKITPKSRIIVYDNGSKDQSVQIAKKMVSK